jgi:plasmid stabilization system protein ParE
VCELIVRPEAGRDLFEAFTWYEEKRQGLGHDFLLHVHAGFRFLERTPLVFPEHYKGVRCHLIKRFPYKIFYRVEAQKVIILGVIYGGRDPAWIKKRIKSI